MESHWRKTITVAEKLILPVTIRIWRREFTMNRNDVMRPPQRCASPSALLQTADTTTHELTFFSRNGNGLFLIDYFIHPITLTTIQGTTQNCTFNWWVKWEFYNSVLLPPKFAQYYIQMKMFLAFLRYSSHLYMIFFCSNVIFFTFLRT